MLRILIALFLISFATTSQAVTSGCRAEEIREGLSRKDIDARCGTAALTHAQITGFVHKSKGERVRETFQNEKYMVFDQGPEAKLFVVALRQGKVVDTQPTDIRGTAGEPLPNCFAADYLRRGLENFLVEYLCGLPDSVELVESREVALTNRLARTVNTERWSYLRDGKRYTIVITDNHLEEIGR